MNKTEIRLADWQRLLFGNAPLEFLLEVVIRTGITYCILLIVIRLLGKRMSGQLTSTEMAVMLVLGAIVSVPMQTPERGLLQGAWLLFLIMGFQQLLTNWMRKNEKVERKLQGTTSILVKDGVLQLKEMEHIRLSREQLFAVLRGQEIFQLGAVKRLYLEACGDFSTYKWDQARPGLSILPRMDKEIRDIQQQAAPEDRVCFHCGNVQGRQHTTTTCTVCGNDRWETPVL